MYDSLINWYDALMVLSVSFKYEPKPPELMTSATLRPSRDGGTPQRGAS
jgi:hypothetical protein